MRPFDCLSVDCPLLGPHLLEASAGTGKTFAIEHIFVRLLLEGLDVEQILVVTFTRAAVRDLKLRIRSNIERVLREKNVPYLQASSGYEQKLADGLAAFDRCQIFTIHGFCYRMLQEFAFEANLGFSLPDPDRETKVPQRLRRAALEFLERGIGSDLIYPEQMAHLLKDFDSLKELAAALKVRGKEFEPISFPELSAWGLEEQKLLEDFHLLSPCYKVKEGNFALQITALAKGNFRSLLSERASLLAFLDPSNKRVKAKSPEGLHYSQFWQWASAHLYPLMKKALDRKRILSTIRAAWRKIEEPLLAEEQWLDPDGILLQMQQAIQREAFASPLRGKYEAVLIDEFQDTDPLQWEIFQTLFLKGKQLKALYLVGDPKQSIYRFRQADVYTYFQARTLLGEESLFSLETNFRSSPDLIGSLNALFARNWLPLPKTGTEISCPPVKSGSNSCSFDDALGAIHFLMGEKEPVLSYTLNEIERLRPFVSSLSSFAILVKDRYQADEALRALQSRRIPAITRSRTPLGKTAAFQAARELFASLTFPRDPLKKRVAEAGPFSSLCSFQSRVLLEEKGLIFFCRRLFDFQGEGEFQRDLKQLIEELLLWEGNKGFSFQGLLRFLDDLEKLDPEEGGRRHLDVELDAVQILTLHASKGLEFEVVFALALGSGQPEEEEEAEEFEAEKLRQLYVAMTRAKRRLYVPVNFSEESSPIQRFFQILETQEGPIIPFLEKLSKTQSLTWQQLPAHLPCPEPKPQEADLSIQPLFAAPVIIPSFLQSFTSLVSSHKSFKEFDPSFPIQRRARTPHLAEQENLDANSLKNFCGQVLARVLEKTAQPPISSEEIPRGAETGIVVHRIFELIFSSKKPIWKDRLAVRELVDAELQGSFLFPWAEPIQTMVDRTLHLPLIGPFCLADLERDLVQTEMPFLFSQPPNYVVGVIDLVFFHGGKIYFLDWKTNWLGEKNTMDQVMTEHDYWLQGRLYAEALKRHVKRLYKEPFQELFGGALYLFVRDGNLCHFMPEGT